MNTSPRLCSIDECTNPHLALGYCKKHYRRFKQYGDPLHRSIQDSYPAPEGMRVCTKCLETKSMDDFGNNKRYKDGKQRICNACMASNTREWAAKNREHARKENSRRTAKSKYGVAGVEVWERIQSGESCEVCGERTSRMAIDHSHTNGLVRGLLCSNCNTALGLLKEDPTRIQMLCEYLLKDRHAEAALQGVPLSEDDDLTLNERELLRDLL